jgi:hypothetical protein
MPSDLERSLEYRNYMKVQIDIAREVEKKYMDHTIGAPLLFAQMIALPRLGYVSKAPFDVMIYGYKENLKGYRRFRGLSAENIYKTVWVGLDYEREEMNIPGYPYSDKDLILKKIQRGDIEGALFMGGSGIERMRIVYKMDKEKIDDKKQIYGSLDWRDHLKE